MGLRRLGVTIVWLAGLAALAFIAYVLIFPHRPPAAGAPPAKPPVSSAETTARPVTAKAPAPLVTDCAAPGFESAAAANGASLATLTWAPFHRPEIGWQIYAPRIALEIGVACAPDSAGFAKALARWQGAHRLPASGQLDAATFGAMNTAWELERPFVRLSQTGVCPDPPAADQLAWATAAEGYEGKAVQLRIGALAAYRRLVAAARADDPAISADPRLLTLFSGYRDPDSDAARCAKENNCGNVTRALCSAHRTGLAMDLYLGAAPGDAPESSDDANRLYQAQSPAYAWLIAHGADYGFVNYPFEPWHWEWTGEAP